MLRIKGWCCKMDSDGIRDSPDTTRLDRLDPTSVIRFVRAAFGLVDRHDCLLLQNADGSRE